MLDGGIFSARCPPSSKRFQLICLNCDSRIQTHAEAYFTAERLRFETANQAFDFSYPRLAAHAANITRRIVLVPIEPTRHYATQSREESTILAMPSQVRHQPSFSP